MDTTKKTKAITASQTSSLSSDFQRHTVVVESAIQDIYLLKDKIEEAKDLIAVNTCLSMNSLIEHYKRRDLKAALMRWQKELSEPGYKDQFPIRRCIRADDGTTLSLLMLILIDLCEKFNADKVLNKDQIYEVALYVQLNYDHLSIEDIIHLCAGIAEGHYGKIFSLDTASMLGYLKQYDAERLKAIQNLRERESRYREDYAPRQSNEDRAMMQRLEGEAKTRAAVREGQAQAQAEAEVSKKKKPETKTKP